MQAMNHFKRRNTRCSCTKTIRF